MVSYICVKASKWDSMAHQSVEKRELGYSRTGMTSARD